MARAISCACTMILLAAIPLTVASVHAQVFPDAPAQEWSKKTTVERNGNTTTYRTESSDGVTTKTTVTRDGDKTKIKTEQSNSVYDTSGRGFK